MLLSCLLLLSAMYCVFTHHIKLYTSTTLLRNLRNIAQLMLPDDKHRWGRFYELRIIPPIKR
ncbi:hypothetical protein PF005_g30369 [Phytophthora fragariae]|uniref:Secreted protein n=1 Tax=Phytophthora fragariae TaxID=53985 RepID=A0A6A3GYY2_9STRA|nr:hypothetical protein PF003_g24514 [Phytophthora fragariae]KAE8923075.1 hypothetical protein PF009_g26669 [Phytophthora fragariae]KAE8962062.1 hypothetical protein PF011_g29523 [Phytophthora fragariae]KAE9067501.1 hypothetical protein PF006_g29986 [Phytophthora fragariae]KAE9068909.1 hypothetical protein PF007_g27513 [Phytophthora fragariae]